MAENTAIDVSLGLALKLNTFFSKEVQGSDLLEKVSLMARNRMRSIMEVEGEVTEEEAAQVPLSYILPALTDHDVLNLVQALAKGAGTDLEEAVNYLLLIVSQEASHIDLKVDISSQERDALLKVLAFSQMRLMRLSRSNKKLSIAKILQEASLQDSNANKLFSVLPTIFGLEVDQRKNQMISE